MPGTDGDFVDSVSPRDDPGKPQLSVNPLARTSKFRPEHMIEAVQCQAGVLLVQLYFRFHGFAPSLSMFTTDFLSVNSGMGGGNTGMPQHQIEAIARCILPDILAFDESEEGQREFAE